jgi:hypothetical protein
MKLAAIASLLATVAAAACGGSPAPAAPNAPSAPNSPTAPTPTALDAASAGPCLAAVLERRPTAPVDEVGKIIVHHVAPDCSIEAKGKDGATTKTPVACKGGREAREAMKKAACSLGGDALWVVGAPPSEATPIVELAVGRYTKPDEAADLKLVCAPFGTLPMPDGKTMDPSSVDESQRARLRAMVLEENLTSRKWRMWLHDLVTAREPAVATLRDAAKKASLTCEAEWVK